MAKTLIGNKGNRAEAEQAIKDLEAAFKGSKFEIQEERSVWLLGRPGSNNLTQSDVDSMKVVVQDSGHQPVVTNADRRATASEKI